MGGMKSLSNGHCKKKVPDDSKEGKNTRQHWSNSAEFILSGLAYAVGLGNIWRFPYICFENGGGAFLIPYTIMLIFVGLPLLLMEYSLGQFSAHGAVTIWEISPMFKGVGVAMFVSQAMGNLQYAIVITWALYYLFASFQATLPWQGCRHPSFNTNNCYSRQEAEPCETENGTWYNQTCYNHTYISSFDVESEVCNETTCWNTTYNWLQETLDNSTTNRVSPSEEYFNHAMLDRSARMEDTGNIKWDVCLIFLLVWIITFLCISKGVKNLGKIGYVTAIFPYINLTILLVYGATLPGARNGIEFFLKPTWSRLLTSKVWIDAAGQIFYSISVATGGQMTYASYNKFHNNIYRDVWIITIGNSLTSLYSGFVIFSVLGFMANDLGVEVKDVASSGSGLVFVAYPALVTRLPLPPLWSFLFFIMLVILGMGSLNACVENVMTGIVDTFPRIRSKRVLVALVMSAVSFILGLLLCTKTGAYYNELINYYGVGLALVIFGLSEALIYAWIYGARRLMGDIEMMVGFKLNMYWFVCWLFITPGIIIAVLVFNFYHFTPLSYGDYLLPDWAQTVGWLMFLSSVLMIPLFVVIQVVLSYRKSEYDDLRFVQRLRKLTQPSKKWKPAIEKEKAESFLHTENGFNSQIQTDVELQTFQPLNRL